MNNKVRMSYMRLLCAPQCWSLHCIGHRHMLYMCYMCSEYDCLHMNFKNTISLGGVGYGPCGQDSRIECKIMWVVQRFNQNSCPERSGEKPELMCTPHLLIWLQSSDDTNRTSGFLFRKYPSRNQITNFWNCFILLTLGSFVFKVLGGLFLKCYHVL